MQGQVTKETTRHIVFAPVISVGTTPTALSLPGIPDGIQKGVIIKAPGPTDVTPNTLSVFLGTSKVTADQTAGTGGFPLAPGESITLPIDDPSGLYAIATDANQKLNVILI